MINKFHQGNSLEFLKTIDSETIDCSVSSPPYYKLRNYNADGQIGQEETYSDYISNLILIYNEIYRVLKPSGTCFVNLGDSFNANKSGNTNPWYSKSNTNNTFLNKSKVNDIGLKSLMLLPERFAIEMVNSGWILRNKIIWHKPNQMPQSSNDRFTVDFENIFFFTKKSKDYYFEKQIEPYTTPINRWGGSNITKSENSIWDSMTGHNMNRDRNNRPNPEGRNMRTVWSINTEPSGFEHCATFPLNLAKRMIKTGCPQGGIVIDPFMGTGTTAQAALELDRNFVGIDINPDYVKYSNDRIKTIINSKKFY